MDILQLQQHVLAFRDARDWKQFHNPKDLAAAIAIEAGELQEKFLWKSQEESYLIGKTDPEVAHEMADVLANLLLLADACAIDLGKACMEKLEHNKKKYPVEKSKGNNTKYTKL